MPFNHRIKKNSSSKEVQIRDIEMSLRHPSFDEIVGEDQRFKIVQKDLKEATQAIKQLKAEMQEMKEEMQEMKERHYKRHPELEEEDEEENRHQKKKKFKNK